MKPLIIFLSLLFAVPAGANDCSGPAFAIFKVVKEPLVANPKVYVISAPSGGGKSTLITKLLSDYRDRFSKTVSTTTRAPRGKEVNGVEYHFVSVEDFKKRIEEGEFVEWAEVHGNYYGTSRKQVEEILSAGKNVILDINVDGAARVKEMYGERAELIFIRPPSMEVLEKRLRGRGTDSEEVIQKRLGNARKEMEAAKDYDQVVINDNLDKAYQDFKNALLGEIPAPPKP